MKKFNSDGDVKQAFQHFIESRLPGISEIFIHDEAAPLAAIAQQY